MIYLLERRGGDPRSEIVAMLVVAPDVRTARSLASARDARDPSSWRSSKETSCKGIDPGSAARILMADYRQADRNPVEDA